jgi:hypothetical protein
MSNQVTVIHKWQNRGVLFLIGAAVCIGLGYWVLQSWFRLSGTLSSEPENLESVSGLILSLVIELVIGVGSLTVTAGGFAWWLLKDLGSGAVTGFTSLRGSQNETKQVEAALSDNPAFAGIATQAAPQATTTKIDERKLAGILKSIIARLDKLDPPPPPPPTVEELQAEIERLREETKTKPSPRKAGQTS